MHHVALQVKTSYSILNSLNELLNNLSYYSEKIYLPQRSLNRASKDLATLEHIDYSILPKTGEYDIDFIENLLLMDFLT